MIYIADACCDKAKLIVFGSSVVMVCPDHAPKIINDGVMEPVKFSSCIKIPYTTYCKDNDYLVKQRS